MKARLGFIFIIIICISICVVYFWGCKQNTNEPTNNEKFNNPYAKVGELHNNAFVYILKEIEVDKANEWQPVSKEDLETKIIDHLKEYNLKMNLTNDIELFSIISENNKNKGLYKSYLLDDVSPKQKLYLDKIDNLIFEKKETHQLQKALSELEAEAVQSLSEIEAAPVLSKSAVALASKIYWKENFNTWVKTISGKNHLNKNTELLAEEIFERLVWADACGAAAGALAAIASGQLYAITGMAATGAAYGTAIEAIIILWELLSGLE